MRNKWQLTLPMIVLGTIPAFAQTTVTTSGGSTNTVPVFTGSSTVGSSPISVASGNVGIGTTSPGTALQVVGTGNVLTLGEANNGNDHQFILGVNNSGNGYGIIQSVYQGAAWTPLVLNPYGGDIGIGVTNPQANLHVVSSAGGTYTLTEWEQASAAPSGTSLIGHRFTTYGGDYGYGGEIAGYLTQNVGGGLTFSTIQNASPVEAMRINQLGNVGLGTMSPQAKLEINGNLRFTADGSVQTTAWTGVLCGGDYAEAVEATGNKTAYQPGDVLVISGDNDKDVQKSRESYSTAVAGIYATRPGVIGKRESLSKVADDIPMAMMGIVPTKVTAENGPIRRGDLLVTASMKGYAMKGTDRSRMLGAVIGKAMGSLASGTGVIEVLVTLQ